MKIFGFFFFGLVLIYPLIWLILVQASGKILNKSPELLRPPSCLGLMLDSAHK